MPIMERNETNQNERVISFPADDTLIAAIDREARHHDRSRSAQIRVMLKAQIEADSNRQSVAVPCAATSNG